MERRIDRLNIPALAAAAAIAPAVTMLLYLLIGVASDPGLLTPAMGDGAVKVLGALLLLPVAAVVFGWFGAIILLGIMFAILAVCGSRLGFAPTRRLYALAGVATGALHVGLAYLSLRLGFPFTFDMVLGSWLAKSAFTNGPLATALAPLLAGALAGVFYAVAAGVGRRRQAD